MADPACDDITIRLARIPGPSESQHHFNMPIELAPDFPVSRNHVSYLYVSQSAANRLAYRKEPHQYI